jgi:predicted glycogen debranching enzyme
MKINFGADVCGDLEASSKREWLETNGIGGYASATISGMNTRRYHGLLVAAFHPPTDRRVLLSKMEETVVLANGARIELGTNRYPNSTVHPQGFKVQTAFRLDPSPIFTFRVGQIEIEKSLFMLHGENTVVLRYRLRLSEKDLSEANADQNANVRLELRPLLAFRDYHSMQHENSLWIQSDEIERNLIRFAPHDSDTHLFIRSTASQTDLANVWYRNFEYEEERIRGFDFHEDLLNPCVLIFESNGANESETVCDLVVSTNCHDEQDAHALAEQFETSERARRAKIERHFFTNAPRFAFNDFVQNLYEAADAYIVRRADTPTQKNLHSIIAGYHWFTDWGRDTMISLTGLTLATRRFSLARNILRAFAAYMNEGLIPNRFPDYDEPPEYNTIDGTLWFFHAAREYLRRANDEKFVRDELYEKLKESIHWHERGTKYDIRMTDDGLLRGGNPHVQLTWMDAKVGDWVVTPRTGKPVEIQALWYNALRVTAELAWRFQDAETQKHCAALAERARASFKAKFWNANENCLYDYLTDDDMPNAQIRPNQIFAVSLPHAILQDAERARAVVAVVERELLTPFGLRSLSPRDPEYRPRYEGDARSRDAAYHQGTVWAWLIGAFINAYLKTHGRTPDTLARARTFTEGFRAHLLEAGLGQISEIFDAAAPHTPCGCIAQAWSIAEVLRCELEELN